MITQNQLPDLPHGQWTANIHSGFNEIQTSYIKVVELLAMERSTEPTRLQAKLESLRSKHILLRGLMEQGVPREWVRECAKLCLAACAALEEAAEATVGEDHTHYTRPTVVQTIRTGRPGRPRKVITPAILKEAFRRDRNIKIREFADKVGVGRNLAGKALKEAGLTVKHDHLPPEQLDNLVRQFRVEHPTSGRRYLGGRTLRLGLRIPRKDLVEASNRVDGRLGVALRTHRQIIRRGYKVTRPNSVSHTDGYHKLIRYGWVIHGVTDGFSRLITALEVHTNNRASTVLKMFKKATKRYGLPERVRGDRGGENIKVAVYMVRKRGMGRGSFIWGTSTRNTRIERLWVEVGSQFARQWKVFFIRLEDLFGLDVSKEGHLWLLHQLFQEDLNQDCKNFRQDWNSHGISGSLTNGRTPRDLCQLEHGVVGELPLLGDSSPESSSTDSDASSDSEMLDPDQREREEMLETAILADERRNIHHAPREPDDDPNPFHGNTVAEEMFWSFLQHQIDLVHIPDGYPFFPWDEIEEMKVGKRQVDIHLPEELWVPRAIRWARGLESMINCMEMLDSLSDE